MIFHILVNLNLRLDFCFNNKTTNLDFSASINNLITVTICEAFSGLRKYENASCRYDFKRQAVKTVNFVFVSVGFMLTMKALVNLSKEFLTATYCLSNCTSRLSRSAFNKILIRLKFEYLSSPMST